MWYGSGSCAYGLQRVAPMIGLLLLAGCDVFGPQACELVVNPGIQVEVSDATTGAPIATGVSGRAYSRNYETPFMSTGSSRLIAETGAGVFTVELKHPSYETWTASGVRVEADGCGVLETRRIQAKLVPNQ